jgi:hypothetical protein
MHRPTDTDPISLARPAFVLALALLLANDLVLKPAYPGWLTGKLSDFAGLFALPYFLAWLWPRRRFALHVGVALAFVAWKLPLSRPFVALWNAAPWFDIARVEDITDLVALASVCLAWRATPTASRRVVDVPAFALAFVALLAFTATSKVYRAAVRGTYFFAGTAQQLEGRLRAVGSGLGDDGKGHWGIDLPGNDEPGSCGFGTSVEVTLEAFGAGTLVQLREFSGHCDFKGDRYRQAIRDFNRVALAAGLDPGHDAASLSRNDPGRVNCPPSTGLPGGTPTTSPEIEPTDAGATDAH